MIPDPSAALIKEFAAEVEKFAAAFQQSRDNRAALLLRDVAIVMGSLNAYGDSCRQAFQKLRFFSADWDPARRDEATNDIISFLTQHVIFANVETYLPYLRQDYVGGLRAGRLAPIRRLLTPKRQLSAAEQFVDAAGKYLDLMHELSRMKPDVARRIWEAMSTNTESAVVECVDELLAPLENTGQPLLRDARGSYGVIEAYILRRHKNLVRWSTVMTRWAGQEM